MAVVLKSILGKEERIKKATSSYIDDILVDETIVPATEVVRHLERFGLIAKPPESMVEGAALGLKLQKDRSGELVFRRGNEIPELSSSISRRELFSVCGKLIGHYLIAGWLCTACSYTKRRAEGESWSDKVGEATVAMMREILERTRAEDSVRGNWYVPKTECRTVWCDASSIVIGVVLEIEGAEVEDAAWLQKADDFNHMNVAELDAVLKEVNLALRWGLHSIEIRTDSATMVGWVGTVINSEKRVRTKGAAEMLVKRCLGVLGELIAEFGLKLNVVFVPLERNRADALTRVKRAWLEEPEEARKGIAAACRLGDSELKELHAMYHLGVDRTLYLAKMIDADVTRRNVKKVVTKCDRCQSIDPAPEHSGCDSLKQERAESCMHSQLALVTVE
ncbi:uncharacterized protein LOC106872883 [Octopus bimaculoides]|uniref:uncharacterized protein LOC106872883 n=1 Tax=Octopus bimaculoides TaxID=37653 RepID=UPI00071D0B3F|nr:uncharacterized protein LOC106872883 [Octopus bimaculoides]|eukprot:XP_014775525.1 PREDICTED: uncharacterized protein LOC106872883 [Octopus bimaculoides]